MEVLSFWSYQIKLAEKCSVLYPGHAGQSVRSSRERTSDEQNLSHDIKIRLFDNVSRGKRKPELYVQMCCSIFLLRCVMTISLIWDRLGSGANSMKHFRWQAAPRRVGAQWLRLFLNKTGIVSLIIFTPPPAVSARSRFCCWSCEPWRPLPPRIQEVKWRA